MGVRVCAPKFQTKQKCGHTFYAAPKNTKNKKQKKIKEDISLKSAAAFLFDLEFA